MSNRTVIQDDFFKGRQSIELHRTVRVDDVSLRIVIDRDSYDDQSYGRAEAWVDDGWKMVVHRRVKFLRAASYSPYSPAATLHQAEVDFSADADDLETLALATLGKVAA